MGIRSLTRDQFQNIKQQTSNIEMKLNLPLFIFLRIVLYSALIFGIAQGIFFDAVHPMEDGYFGELTFTEIGQEIILFVLFVFFLIFGFKNKDVRVICHLASLFFLMAFIREFNFLIDKWIYPVLGVLSVFIFIIVKRFKQIKNASIQFFSIPASQWLLTGFLVTFIFSRLMGRSKFWRVLYSDESYRLAKAATEEGLELMGNTLMLIGAIEFTLYYLIEKNKS